MANLIVDDYVPKNELETKHSMLTHVEEQLDILYGFMKRTPNPMNANELLFPYHNKMFIPKFYDFLYGEAIAKQFENQLFEWEEICVQIDSSYPAHSQATYIMSELKKYTGTGDQRKTFIALMEFLVAMKAPDAVLIGVLYFELEESKPDVWKKWTWASQLNTIISDILSTRYNPLHPERGLNQFDPLIFLQIAQEYLLQIEMDFYFQELINKRQRNEITYNVQWENRSALLKDFSKVIAITVANNEAMMAEILKKQFPPAVLIKRLNDMRKKFDGKKLSDKEAELLENISLIGTRFKMKFDELNKMSKLDESTKKAYDPDLTAIQKIVLGTVFYTALVLTKGELFQECLTVMNFKKITDISAADANRWLGAAANEFDNLKQTQHYYRAEEFKRRYADVPQDTVGWGKKIARTAGRHGWSIFAASSIVKGFLYYAGEYFGVATGPIGMGSFVGGCFVVKSLTESPIVSEAWNSVFTYLGNQTGDNVVENTTYYFKATKENFIKALEYCQLKADSKSQNPTLAEKTAEDLTSEEDLIYAYSRLQTDFFSAEQRRILQGIYNFNAKTGRFDTELIKKDPPRLG